MWYKPVSTCPFKFDFLPDQYLTEELCDKVVFEDPFMLKYCPAKHETQETCDKAVDFYLLQSLS